MITYAFSTLKRMVKGTAMHFQGHRQSSLSGSTDWWRWRARNPSLAASANLPPACNEQPPRINVLGERKSLCLEHSPAELAVVVVPKFYLRNSGCLLGRVKSFIRINPFSQPSGEVVAMEWKKASVCVNLNQTLQTEMFVAFDDSIHLSCIQMIVHARR